MRAHNPPKADLDGIKDTARKLAIFADAAQPRPDWHEPDEQGITAVVKGRKLDNAHGDEGNHDPRWAYTTCPDGKRVNMTEKVVILKCDETGDETQLSLATVLALATVGARALVTREERNNALAVRFGPEVFELYKKYATYAAVVDALNDKYGYGRFTLTEVKALVAAARG